MAATPSTPNLPFGPPGSQKKPKYPVFHWTRSDSSIFPSYTNLDLPYRVKCRQRYWNSYKEQRRQFISEVAMQELLQAMALDGVRVHREFCKYIFSKPSAKEKITLTEAEERRLLYTCFKYGRFADDLNYDSGAGACILRRCDTVKNGHIRRVIDDEVKSLVLEISGTNVATTYITCPIKPRASLSIRLPFLVMIVKNMKKYFTFEIQILDDKDMHRRFRVSNFQSTTKVRPFCTTMPIGLSSGWNQIQFNLADFTRRAYGTLYLETMRVQIHANVRIRRIYFADRLYSEDEMPSEYRLFVPLSTKEKPKEAEKESSIKGSKTSKLSQPKELEEPSAAPPSPVLTEPAMLPAAEEVQVNVEQYGDETATEEMRTDTEVTEMTEEPASEIAPSEDAPPTDEPATDAEGAAEAAPAPEAEPDAAPPAEPEPPAAEPEAPAPEPPAAEPEAPPADAPEEKPAE